MSAFWNRVSPVVTGLAQTKIAFALLLVLTGTVPVRGAELFRIALVVVLLASSLLLSASRGDGTKSKALGRVMAFFGARMSLGVGLASNYGTVWQALHPEAFIGIASVVFARAFGAVTLPRFLLPVTLLWGVTNFLARLVLGLGLWSGLLPGALLERWPSWDWIPTYLLALLAVFPLLHAWGLAEGAERRQLRLFVSGLAIGVAPLVLILPAAALFPWFNDWLQRPEIKPLFLALTYPFLMVFPITATYAVLYQGALDYQSALRRAAQYALARYTLLALVAIPLSAGVVLLYANREEPLGRLLTGWRFLALAGVAAGAAVAFPLRHRLLAALDRRYFREAYDARLILHRLGDAVRKTRDISELSRLLVEQVDAALHVDGVVLMVVNPEQAGVLRAVAALNVPEPDPLTTTAQFVALLAGSADPLPIDPTTPGSLIARLPEGEKEWLQNAGAALLVPLLGSGETLVGFLSLGRRRSETAFSAEDRDLLASVGSAAGLAFETRLMRATPTPGGNASTPARDETPLARECLACLRIFEASALSCARCGASTQPALLPLTVLDKYKLETRLGAGGFGVVYSATEMRLGRRVALKTLPRLSGEKVERFKREALAAAAIQHPNLAMIHTAETWNETPILVFELLEGGTLAQRLTRGTLSFGEALDLGAAMASVLEEAHCRGILHRDIKPSNIGYDARQNPKLLDFGIARVRFPSTPGSADDVDTITLERLQRGEVNVPPTIDAPLTETGAIVGTLAYLPLEAYQNHEPGPSFDLWALSVTIYESLSGVNPFRASSPAETIERLLRTTATPLGDLRGDCPPALTALLVRALSRNRRDRPQSATDFHLALRELRNA